ncbi:MAG: GGDEF domain-containing protein, partial [Treponema sp.]|nr:GGDEF domain-containing protein [Treponema sp.]
KFGLDMSLLPSKTNFVNRPVKYFQQYKAFVFSVCLFLLGIILIFIAMMLNYSMLKSAEVRLQYDVDHDLSLGTFNRHAAEHYLESELNNKHHIAMLRIDIDNFKTLNETYGHAVGDQYLHHAAGLLKRYAEDNNYYLARYSGDEFIMFVSEANVLKDSPAVLGVHEIFKTPMTVGMESLKSTVSIGLVNSDINSTVDSMFVNSEIAKSSAKEHGKNTAAVFTSEFEESARTVNVTRTKVMNAIEKGGFYMVYQPKVDVQTRELVGYEALVRIKDDNISPAVFIPVAEQSGLISQIGRITTELAIRQLAEWREQGIELHPISINYSSNQINDAGYIKFLKGLLKKYDIDPKYVEIEITEGLFMESTWQAGNLFVQFQAMGIKLLMDDFGTGYSSLSYLTYIPVDILKLDRSLVVNYLVKGKDAFIRDVINLTHDLGKKMVIEGVEEEWQFERLKEFGADVIQGYYFSKPLPPEDACRWTWKGSK